MRAAVTRDGQLVVGEVPDPTPSSGHVVVRSLAQFWTTVDAPSLAAFKVWLEHTLPMWLANGAEGFLNVYSWAPFGVLGVILAFAFGRHSED